MIFTLQWKPGEKARFIRKLTAIVGYLELNMFSAAQEELCKAVIAADSNSRGVGVTAACEGLRGMTTQIRSLRQTAAEDVEIYRLAAGIVLVLAYELKIESLCGIAETEYACGHFWLYGRERATRYLNDWFAGPTSEVTRGYGFAHFAEDPDFVSLFALVRPKRKPAVAAKERI